MYPSPYPEINHLLLDLCSSAQAILEKQCVGMYLFGSLAGGDFDSQRSDIDFAIVTEGELSVEKISALEAMHTRLASNRSPWAKRLEGSYIPKQALRRYDPATARYPSLRMDGSFAIDQQGMDGIIQRHLLREQGITIAGPSPRDLIDPILPDDLRRASIGILFEWWQPQLADQHRLLEREYQAYAVLTMCRILFTLQFGTIVSKPHAARWAQTALDEPWMELIARALTWHPADGVDDLCETIEFIRYTLERAAHLATPPSGKPPNAAEPGKNADPSEAQPPPP